MHEVSIPTAHLPAMSASAIAIVRTLQMVEGGLPQVPLETEHLFHAGMYLRTVLLPAGVMLTGALIRIATVVIVEGDCIVWLSDQSRRLTGYNRLPASAGRKQAFSALLDTHITMIFPTEAQTVEEAEAQFTTEADLLASRREDAHNTTVITGER